MTGTRALLALALRRDRVLLPAWIIVFVVVAASSAASVVALYPTGASVAATALAVNGTPSLLALYGPIYDPTSVGALAIWKPAGSGAALLAVLTGFTVIRHTRTEEEVGRLELLGSTGLGRGVPLAVAGLVGVGTALVVGVLSAVALAASGLPVAGSLAFGAAWAGCGVVFAGVGAVAAQLTRSARTARGLTVAALLVAFLLRAAGDASGPAWLTWLSPLGWAQLVRAYAGERWWLLSLPLASALVLGVLADRLDASRDLGTGILVERPGPATGPDLRSPLALAWRLQRGPFAAWTAGFVLVAALLGSLTPTVAGLLDNPALQDVIRQLGGRQALTDAVVATDLGVLGLLAAGFAVASVLRLHGEEEAGRAEAVLSGPVGRIRWAGGHVLVAAAGSALLMAVAGAAVGVADGARSGRAWAGVPRFVGAALVQVPAVWVLAAVALALVGFAPRAAPAVWVLLAGAVLVAELGPLLRLRQWVLDLSPFTHVPHLPGGAFSVVPLVWLTAVAAGLTVAGLAALRRRDLA